MYSYNNIYNDQTILECGQSASQSSQGTLRHWQNIALMYRN